MKRSRRRAVTALAAGGICLGSGLGLLMNDVAHADDVPGSGFLSLALLAESGGQRIVTTGDENRVGDGAAETNVPYASATLSTTAGHALSSVVWPGSLAGNLGGSLVLIAGAPSQATVLNDPVRAEAQTGSGEPEASFDSIPGLVMTAKAHPAEVVADAQLVGDKSAPVGTFGQTHVNSRTAITGAHEAVAAAQSTVQKVSTGVVTIGSVTSTATVTTDGQTAKGSGETVVTNMKVANIPVSVDQNGVTVTGRGGSAKAAQEAVNKAMAQSGTSIFLTTPHESSSTVGTSYDAGALVMSFDNGGFFVVLGGARAVAGSTPATAYSPPPPPATQPAPFVPGTPGTPAVPGTPGLPATSAGTLPGQPTAQAPTFAPQLAGTPYDLPGGLSPWWAVPVILGVGLILAGMRALPTRLLDEAPTVCPLGER